MTQETDAILAEVATIIDRLKLCDYRCDSINSLPKNRVVDALTSRNRWLGIAWRQFFRIMPVNLRHWFGEAMQQKNPKAMLLLSLAFLDLWTLTREGQYLDDLLSCLDWIVSQRSKTAKGFAVPQLKRIYAAGYRASESDVSPFLTYWAGLAFLEAHGRLGDGRYLSLAEEAGTYFLDDLTRKEDEDGSVYFFYVPNQEDGSRCYNGSALVSSYLIRLGHATGKVRYAAYGERGIDCILKAQNRNGSWFYRNGRSGRYIDNFHTAFILLALYEANRYLVWPDVGEAFARGLDYYVRTLFEWVSDDMIRPRHFDGRYLPRNSNLIQKVDLRDAAVAIALFSLLRDRDAKYGDYARSVLNWTTAHMKGKNGYFCEITWLWPNRIPYIEFQAGMLLAFTKYLGFLAGEAGRPG